ncbi:cytochrome P450 monooxygenase [Abortiporus biennis]|nr:cytochrome P450 monooxygenase [Abortiporus biennis]
MNSNSTTDTQTNPTYVGFLQTPGLIAALVVAYYFILHVSRRDTRKYPPGPKPLPVLGNVHQLPLEYQESAFADWGKKYGGILYAHIFRTPTIVINSVDIAHDILDKRWKNYSDRPRFVMLAEMLGHDHQSITMPYNDRFRKQRAWTMEVLSRAAISSFAHVQRRESGIFFENLLKDPSRLPHHAFRFAAGVILDITYGHRVMSDDDEQLNLSMRAFNETANNGSPGALLVDFFPFLKHYPEWLPGSGFITRAKELRALIHETHIRPLQIVKQKMTEGVAGHSLAAELYERSYRNGTVEQDEEDIKGVTSQLYGAGTETTSSTITAFMLAMVRHPEVQKKAQEEVDRIVGTERLPDFEDRASMPYIDALLLELYRYHSALPLGVPHRSVQDDEYNGLFIPAKTTMIFNLWGMSHNPEMYPDPDVFRPERFLDIDQKSLDSISPKSFMFGFGRRLCPGRDLAEGSLFLVITGILATMNIGKVRDENSKEITPPYAFTGGFASAPKPFQFTAKPRSQKALKLITQLNQNLGNDDLAA